MESFQELIDSPTLVLIDFYATWCGPCKTMHPILEELKKMQGENLRIIKIDVDRHEALAAKQRIQSVPTLMLFKKGQMLWRQSGVVPLNQLTEIVKGYL